MTIRQMNILLRQWDTSGVIKEGWDKLSETIKNTPKDNKNSKEATWTDGPLVPAIYLFACVAGRAEKGDEGITYPQLFELISQGFPPFWKDRYGNNNTYSQLRGLFEPEGSSKAAKNANVVPLCAAATTLAMLVDALKGFNYKAWQQKSQWLIPEGGWENLTSVLDAWGDTCEAMWQTVQTLAGEETHEDKDTRLKQQELNRRRAACVRLREENALFRTASQLIEAGVRQIIFTGAPGTGKTYTAGLVAENMGMGWTMPQYWEKLKADREFWQKAPSYPLVQFHPSYDYTDFVEGLRPVEMDGKPTFVKLDGSFKAFCRQVAEQNKVVAKNAQEHLYFFLIDEINRADLSKVFGELMFCLETDKRDMPVQTQYRNLPTYRIDQKTRQVALLPREEDIFADGFFIPQNVVILGTMNDIDRSVESMDFALRRRFEWREVAVTEEMLTQAFASGTFGAGLWENAGEAARRIMALNRIISGGGSYEGSRFGLNRHYYISQGQFAHLPDTQKDNALDELMQYVWDYRIKPLLQEYVRGEDEAAVGAFLQKCQTALESGKQSDE